VSTTIAVSSQKGGVAKTTTCLSLGACLAELGQTVLLIDMDPQAHLTISMGVRPEKVRHTLEDVILGDASLVSVGCEGPVRGLDIVPANRGLVLVDKILYGRKGFAQRLKSSLTAMEEGFYDTVLIDCPPSFGTLTVNALTAADLLISPFQCEYYAAHSLLWLLKLVRLVREKTNPALKYRVLVTMYDRRYKISGIVREQIQQGLGEALFKTIIEVDTKLRESPTKGLPITVYAPHTRAAEQYRSLARELLDGRPGRSGAATSTYAASHTESLRRSLEKRALVRRPTAPRAPQ
jgi:chromosome partitioning protein